MTESATSELLSFLLHRRVPLIRQREAAECGLACAAMVAGAHGYETDLAQLRRRFSTSLRGMSLRDVITVTDTLGFHARALRLEPHSLFHLPLPAILHWDMRHFVVLVRVARRLSRTRFLLHDPSAGALWVSDEELSRHFTGVALELVPSSEFKPVRERHTLRVTQLWSRVTGLKRSVGQVLLLSLLLQATILIAPMYLRTVIDVVLPTFDADLLLALAIGFGGIAIVTALITWLRTYVLSALTTALSYQLVANVFRHLLRLPLQWYATRSVGHVLACLGAARPITDLLTRNLATSILDGLLAVTTLGVMLASSTVLASITVGVATAYALIRIALLRPLRARNRDLVHAEAREASTAIETIQGISAIKVAARENVRRTLWQHRKAEAINAQVRVAHVTGAVESLEIAAVGIEGVLSVYVAIRMAMTGAITVGGVFAYLLYKQSFFRAALNVLQSAIDYVNLDVHLDTMSDVALSEPEGDAGPAEHHELLTGALVVRDVRFRYGTGETEVLCGVNLEVRPGETVAISGVSGCGKTTLLKIMQGLLSPTHGELFIDGRRLKNYGKTAFRSQIGVVAQDDTLYAGSLAENIGFFDSEIDMERVVTCAKLAVIHVDIAAMPMGYETLCGEMGSALSGGQKQRVLLARALYRNPRILFLDEATSHLDIRTEAAVNASIRSLGMTRVLIAHRPESILAADRVVTLVAGRIVESSVAVNVIGGSESAKDCLRTAD
jgi:ATP-binding cassette subfamily B protein RaxB